VTLQSIPYASTIRRLAGRGAFAAGGAASMALSQWYVIVVLGRSYGPSAVGLYTLALAIALPVFTFFYLGLRPMQISEDDAPTKAVQYLLVRVTMLLLASTITLAMGLFASTEIAYAALLVSIVVTRFSDGLSDVSYGAQQREGRFGQVFRSQAFRGISSIIAVSALAYMQCPVEYIALGLAAPWLAIALLLDLPELIKIQTENKNKNSTIRLLSIAAITRKALPLGVAAALISLISSVPRFFLSDSSGTNEVGVYSAVVYLVQLGGIFVISAGQAISPSLAEAYRAGNKWRFAKIVTVGLLFSSLISILSIIAALSLGSSLPRIIYGPDFAISSFALITLFAGGLFVYSGYILGYAMTNLKIYKEQVAVFAISILVCIVSGSILIRGEDALLGAIQTFAITSFSTALFSALAVWILRSDAAFWQKDVAI
jgi:O-antigen/teichoic acid export membrane protein